jgi:hypothetical protein
MLPRDFLTLFELECHGKIVHMLKPAFVVRLDLGVAMISCFVLVQEVVKIGVF